MNEAPAPKVDPVDTNSASVARAYDFMLGGKDNFDVDRQFAATILARDSELETSIRLNKDFGQRSVDYIARQGVTQFLDLGSGIPTSPPSVHHSARRVHADATVVYVDHDPVVVAHNRALRAVGPGLAVVQESIDNIEAIYQHPEFESNIDTSLPIGVLILSVLQNTPTPQALKLMSELRTRLAPGSYVAMTHVSIHTSESVRYAVAEQVKAGRYPPTEFRTDDQIQELFADFDLVEPGLVDYRDWNPGEHLADERPELKTQFLSAVGRLQG